MTITAIRNRLMSYLANADDNKIKAVYTLLEKDIEEKETFVLSDEQLEILEKERELHLSGQTKSYTRNEARQIIGGAAVSLQQDQEKLQISSVAQVSVRDCV